VFFFHHHFPNTLAQNPLETISKRRR
jgi:hypothetical protein